MRRTGADPVDRARAIVEDCLAREFSHLTNAVGAERALPPTFEAYRNRFRVIRSRPDLADLPCPPGARWRTRERLVAVNVAALMVVLAVCVATVFWLFTR